MRVVRLYRPSICKRLQADGISCVRFFPHNLIVGYCQRIRQFYILEKYKLSYPVIKLWVKLIKYNIYLHNYGYAILSIERKNVLIHRFILEAKRGQEIDHINGNKLDNRRCNLRFCTRQGNAANSKIYTRNTSGYKGVYWDDVRNKWRARIIVNYKGFYLGIFKDIKKAAMAYNEAALKYFGEFARLNKLN